MQTGENSRHPSGPFLSQSAPGRQCFSNALSPRAVAPPTPLSQENQEALPSQAFPKEPRENLQPPSGARARAKKSLPTPPCLPPMRWENSGYLRKPTRATPTGPRANAGVKYLRAPSRESSRKSGLSEVGVPPDSPGRPQPPTRLEGPARPLDVALARHAFPEPHPSGPFRWASARPLAPAAGPHAPGAQLQPPPRLSSAQPYPRTPGSVLCPGHSPH